MPVKKRYMTKSPSVIAPARIARPPTTIITTPMTPTMTVEPAVTAETPGDRSGDVVEEPVDARREHRLLALLGDVGLHDADAAQRLGEAAGDLRLDLAALAEERPQLLEGDGHAAAEDRQHDERDRSSAASSARTARRARAPPSTKPPTSCTSPVPIRFRMPSASFMMREMSRPVWVVSK